MPIKSLGGAWALPVVAVTGTTRTILASEAGTLFTNRGASAGCTFTLPVTSSLLNGWWCEFATVAAQAITIATSPTDTLIVHADATADSIVTAGTIGQHIRVVCDGTGFIVISNPSAASTATAVTAVTLNT
jgi:hypothetical protein